MFNRSTHVIPNHPGCALAGYPFSVRDPYWASTQLITNNAYNPYTPPLSATDGKGMAEYKCSDNYIEWDVAADEISRWECKYVIDLDKWSIYHFPFI